MRFTVVKNIVGTPGGMAGQTGRAVVRIAVHPVVLIIRFRVRVTGSTGKLRIVRRICMAFLTLIPHALVFAAVNREIIGIVLTVFCRHPIQIRRVTIGTIL